MELLQGLTRAVVVDHLVALSVDTAVADALTPVIDEVLKSVVAQYNAEQLLSMREQISYLVRRPFQSKRPR